MRKELVLPSIILNPRLTERGCEGTFLCVNETPSHL